MIMTTPHTFMFLFKYCLFVSTYLHPFSLTAGRATGCIWCCAFHASCGAHGAFAQGLWGEGHLLLSPYVPCSVIQCPNSLRILSIKALKEPVAQKTYENILPFYKYHSYFKWSIMCLIAEHEDYILNVLFSHTYAVQICTALSCT